jgi:hypothetical protein
VAASRRRRAWYPRPGRKRFGGRSPIVADQLDDLLTDPIEASAEVDEHLDGRTLALADQTEQDVLRADVVVAELQCLALAQFEDLHGARGEGDVTGVVGTNSMSRPRVLKSGRHPAQV